MDRMTDARYAPIWSVIRLEDGTAAIVIAQFDSTTLVERVGMRQEEISHEEEVVILMFPSELARHWLSQQ